MSQTTTIECVIKRKGGTTIDMGDGMEYDFQPNSSGAHVCEIDDPAHIKTLLTIDCYQIYGSGTTPAAPKSPARVISAAAGFPTLEDGTPDLKALEGDPEAARRAFESILGKPAHPKAKHETVMRRLTEATAERAEPPRIEPVIPDDGIAPEDVLHTDHVQTDDDDMGDDDEGDDEGETGEQ